MCCTKLPIFVQYNINNMLKSAVIRQKEEKERLLSLLYIKRSKADQIQKWLDSDLIKVILGPRRSGKSVFALMMLRGQEFAYFNFDDELLAHRNDFQPDQLLQELHSVYGQFKYLLLDEIQNLPDWELFVNRLHRQGYNIVLTGSNARLLGRELATALTGRHIPIEILPFNFQEFLRAKNYQVDQPELRVPEKQGQLLHLLEQYLVSGGYPEVVVKDLDVRSYLGVLFDSLLFQDVVKRHRVRFSNQMGHLGSYLVNNVTSPYSARRLTQKLDFNSSHTLEKYLGYLVEAYLIFTLQRYSPQAGQRLRSSRKIYVVDNGFVTAKGVPHSPDTGQLMENLVFMELVKRGFQPNQDLFYYQTRQQHEVDFVLKSGSSLLELIQVAYRFDRTETEDREIKALLEASRELKVDRLTILTWDRDEVVQRGSQVVCFKPLWLWLLEK